MAELLVQVSVAVSNSHISVSNFIATSHEFFTPRCSVLEGKWDPLFQWKARLVKDYYLARYIVKSTVVLFFLQHFTYKKRVWRKLQTIPHIYFQMIQIDLFQGKYQIQTSNFNFFKPISFLQRLLLPLILFGFSRFSPSWVVGSFSRCKVAKCFAIAGPRSGLQQSDQSLGYSGATVVFLHAV